MFYKNSLSAFILLLAFAFFLNGNMAEAGRVHVNDEFNNKKPCCLLYVVSNLGDESFVGAKNFVEAMAERAIVFLGNENTSEQEKQREFRRLLEDSFDIKTIGRFALGRYWRSASEKQRRQYIRLFNEMIINVYSERFKDYQGQELEIKDAQPVGKSDILVKSSIVPQSGPEIGVDWRLRYKSGRYKVIDVIVEGVSMAVTQRSDFASVIQKGGGDLGVLISYLEQ